MNGWVNRAMGLSLAITLLAALFSQGCSPLTFVVGASATDQTLEPTVVMTDPGIRPDRIAMIDVSGRIVNSRVGLLGGGENPVSLVHEQLEAAGRDRRVKAVLLRINSPGGTVTASDAMHRMILRHREATGQPVVAMLMDVAASGGYYIACASDHIVAYPSTVTGSIGVLIQTFSVQQAFNRLGVSTEAFLSRPNKNLGSPLAMRSDEERVILQGMVDTFYGAFREVVRTSRPAIAESDFEVVTDGRIFTGAQARELGLVDELGDLHVGFARAKTLAGVDRAQLVVYRRPLQYVGSPYAAVATAPTPGRPQGQAVTQINLGQINLDSSLLSGGTNFYYLWSPSAP